MQLTDFDFNLPSAQIAQYPLPQRSASRLLFLNTTGAGLQDRMMRDLPQLVCPGDLLVFNDTRVIRARLFAYKHSGGRVEIVVERLETPRQALAHVRARKALLPGSDLSIENQATLRIVERVGTLWRIATLDEDFTALLARAGHIPLPPYITRQAESVDENRYQTVYAQREGAIAAPTAGLHFDPALLEQLQARGVEFAYLTLHVGAGTFQPVRSECLDAHVMHTEWLEVSANVCEQVRITHARGGRVIAVGTTSVRGLETAAVQGTLAAYCGETQLFIRPGYQFRVVDALLTNFHLPRSTLLMLVCAFAGYAPVMSAYRHAIAEKYRFFSYGDAMFLNGANG